MDKKTRRRASKDTESKVITLIFSPDEDNDKLYRLPRDTTCSGLIARWTKDYQPSSDFLFFLENGDELRDQEKPLSSLDLSHESTLSLHAVPAELPVTCRLLLDPQQERSLRIASWRSPNELAANVRSAFGFADHQHFRLMLGAQPLEGDRPVWRQAVVSGSQLGVDLEFAGSVHVRWGSRKAQDFALYGSQPAIDLRCVPTECTQRFWMEGRPLQLEGTVAELFGAQRAARRVQLEVEFLQRVSCLQGLEVVQPKLLWPSQRLPLPETLAGGLTFLGKKLDLSKSAGALGIVPDALLQTAGFKTVLQTAPRRFAVRTVPTGASTGDLAPGQFVMRKERAAWNPAEQLQQIVAASLFVATAKVTVTVWMSSKVVQHVVVWKPAARFDDVLAQVKGPLDKLELRTVMFECVGCKRKMRREEEEQEVPATCCRKKSLELRLLRRSKTGGSQTLPLARRTAERGCQTVQKTATRETQTDPCTIENQSVSEQSIEEEAFSTRTRGTPPMEVPENAITVEFFVCNWGRIGRIPRDFRCSLRLPPSPTVSDVLYNLAAEMEVSSKHVRLKQWRAKVESEEVVWVCRQNDSPGDEYGNRNGTTYRRKEVQEDSGVELDNDDAFLVVPGRRNIVVVIDV